MLASTFMDMVLGLDIHFEIVPMSPTPVPIPNPFVGMVWDPGGLLTSQAMGLAAALLSGTPPKGPVLINSMPATTVGTNAKNSLGVPHILMPPGVSWAPMPKLPKPSFKGPAPLPGSPVAPEGDAVCVFGSPTVTLMGTSAVRMGDKAMSCGEPVRLPSSTVLAIPKGPPVMIGGPPALSISDALGALLKSKWIAGYLHDLLSRLSPGRLRSLLSWAVCTLTGHPVDVATGRMMTDHVDFELPGAMPLTFKRIYSSGCANRQGPLGHGWSHSLDQAVWLERGKLVYLGAEGREIELDTFDFPDHVAPVGQVIFEPINRLTLKVLGQRRYEITTASGLTHEFAPVEGASGARRFWSRLTRIRDRGGNAIELDYDRRGCLQWARDVGGRQVGFEHDREDRLIGMKLPHPTAEGWLPHTRYAYDTHGDLVQVTDPLGHAWRFKYKGHLMVEETNRNGLAFYFAYDGFGEDAYCVRTWGDGGIYDHVIDYDKMGKVTYVTNSLGQTTTYKLNVVGCVVKVTDALGGSVATEYDERTLRKVKETDAVGGETRWEYDARGNTTKVTGPDGAVVEIAYDGHDQPVRAVDAMKGEWRWGHDERGHLIGRVDPLQRRVQFQWSAEEAGRDGSGRRWLGQADGSGDDPRRPRRLVGLTDPAGQQTKLGYDAHGNVASLRTPDGAQTRWQYDRLGRCVAVIDAKGNLQTREYDPLGRVVRVSEPDGNLRELEYDPEGNVVHARDKLHDVRFTYRGMGRLASRTEAGTTVGFSYDTEEQLRAITNEHGSVYAFELGATGQVQVERSFDGIRRQYVRDKAGRVTKVFRPAGLETEYAYDAGGRVVAVKHSDGSAEGYAYRADGELVEAKNDGGTVSFERDILGRVVREAVGDDWVASDYDALGMRARIRSSKGLDQRIQRNAVGQMIGVRATTPADEGTGPSRPKSRPGEAIWEATVRRDALGLEIERTLPGGVQSRWDRDNVGRPVKQEVWSAGTFRKAVQYTWDVDDRLKMVIDATRGPIRYEHDRLGNLAAATYVDGRVDLRMPDAVGNLFRTAARGDRKYGPAGQLLEARKPDGSTTRYDYDAEGNLVSKVESDAGGVVVGTWTYAWNGAGMLSAVERPDGETVRFAYDALGRRLSKTFGVSVTRWIWDGHVPLHEWVESGGAAAEPASDLSPSDERKLDEVAARRRQAALAARPPQGPPVALTLLPPSLDRGTREAPITWLFDPETFAPMGKLVGNARYAIITDHLGTPTTMYDAAGTEVWSASIDIYGNLRDIAGDKQACPFRWPGQYEDPETGLYYNRFRYYSPDSGHYVNSDPIGLVGGVELYGYASDPGIWIDPLGLSRCGPGEAIVLGEGMERIKTAVRDLQSQGVEARWYQAWGKNFPRGRLMTPAELDAAVARNERWLISKIKSGATIYDIGRDGRPVPSDFYKAEQSILKKFGIVPVPLAGY